MNLPRLFKPALGVVGAAGLAALLVFAYLEGRQERAREAERERPVVAPSRVTPGKEVPVIALTRDEQRASGIVTTALGAHTRGSPASGIVPESAVVWQDGRAWVYMQQDEEHFLRRAVALEVGREDGWSVHGLRADARVVVTGAQQLLSEEQRAEIEMGE